MQYNRVLVIGSGGVGFWTLPGLARAGLSSITTVYDDDDLQGGLGRLRLPAATVTTRKVDLARGFIRMAMGDTSPAIVAAKFTGREVVAGDLVVDCSDMATGDFRSPRSRKSIHREVLARGGRYLRVSYDGQSSMVVVAEGLPLESRAATRVGGYDALPSLSLSLVAGGLAAEVIATMMAVRTGYIDFRISVRELMGFPPLELGGHQHGGEVAAVAE